MIRNITRYIYFQNKNIRLLSNKAIVSENEKNSDNIPVETVEVIEEDVALSMAEIEKKRNKSRLYNQHRNLLHNKIPYSEPVLEFHKTIKYQRKMFGTYGEDSGVNPGICWPTKIELQEMKEYEKIAVPYTIQAVMKETEINRQNNEEAKKKRQNDIINKFAKLEQWKADLKARVEKKEEEARIAKERKDRLVDEVRRHFGFKIDPRDERFKEMLEQKERAEKKAMKEAKRKIKEARLVAKLQQKKTETVDATETSKNQTAEKS